MKYATLNGNGTPNAFYDSNIHNSIPKEAIKITNGQWLECINNQGCRAFVDGQLVEYIYQKTFIEEKSEKLLQLNTNFEAKALRPRVEVPSLGYFVDGGRDDLDNFKNGRDIAYPFIMDADNKLHPAELADYEAVIRAIQENGSALIGWKWAKKEEINAIQVSDTVTEEQAIDALNAVVIE